MTTSEWINVIITGILFAGVVATGVAYLVSQIRKSHTEEISQLAETRGHRIEDLEDRIEELNRIVQNQQGQIDMLRAFKVEEIVDGVIEGLVARERE